MKKIYRPKVFNKVLFLKCIEKYLPNGKKSSVLIYIMAEKIINKEDDYKASFKDFNEGYFAIDFVSWISSKPYELIGLPVYKKYACLLKDSEIKRLLDLNL